MSTDNLVVVRFVKPAVDSPVSSVLQEAFEAIQDVPAQSVWFTEDDSFSVKTKERKFIYIFEDFKGAAFEHIVNTGNRIYGPVCVLHCLKKATPLPKVPHPVFSLSMQGLVVSCTSLEKQTREQIHSYVEWMSGDVSKDFHQNVTHLVAGEVGSKKYLVAAKLNKKIMSPEWIEKVWEAAHSSFVRGDDPAYDKYRCPVFKGFVITVSGLESNERGKIKDIVTKQGGKYSGEMKINECTHLIINVPRGQKYEFAKQWKIHIVNPKWLYDSLDIGYCLEESDYPVIQKKPSECNRKGHATSTPTDVNSRLSEIPNVSTISVSHINETNMTMLTNASMCSVRNQSLCSINQSEMKPNCAAILESVDLTNPKNHMFLDGCKIFLSGFKGASLEKLRKLINVGGGTRLNQITENVSHFVMGEHVESHVRELQQSSLRPYVVSVDWIVACYHAGETVTEDAYSCLDLPSSDASTPKAKTNKSVPKKQALKGSAVGGEQSGRLPDDGESVQQEATNDMQDLLSQYLPESTRNESMGESTLLRAAELGEEAANPEPLEPEAANHNETLTNRSANQSAVDNDHHEQTDMDTVDPDATLDEAECLLFAGKQFVILGFDATDEHEMAELIHHYHGKVLPVTTRKIPDYAIVPVFGCPVTLTVGDVVTNAWVQMCIEQEQLLPLDTDPFFQPISIIPDSTPLKGCVLSVSGYIGTERDVIVHMAAVLGAVVQDYFVKKANSAKNLEASTHLVVNQAEGSKYKAAKKWKIPAVTKQWIVECAKQNKQLAEGLFLVDQPPSSDTTLKSDIQNMNQAAAGAPEANISRVLNKEEQITEQPSNEFAHQSCAVHVEEENRNHGQPENTPHRTFDTSLNKLQRDRTPQHVECEKENDINIRQKSASLPKKLPDCDIGSDAKEAGSSRSLLGERRASSESTHKFVNNRVRELAAEHKSSPVNQQSLTSSPSGSPQQDKSFHAKFDLADAVAELQSPATPTTPHGTKKGKKKSLSLEEVFACNLEQAVKNQGDLKKSHSSDGTPFSQRIRSAVQEEEKEPPGPLHGIIIAVSKKLSAQQSDYNNIAARLGADYRWTYDSSCTHFIFQGRLNDTNKEFRLAKDQGKIIVSPYWLTMCEEQNCRVDETLFPHTFNPKLSLDLTPARSSRQSSRARVKKSHTDSTSSSEAPSSVKVKDKATFDCLDTTQSDEEMAQVAENIEDKERETNTQVLVNDLKTLMAATRTCSRGRRFNRRNDSFSKVLNQENSGSAERTRCSTGNKQDGLSPCTSKEERRPSRLRNLKHKQETQSEASQMIEVSWDDPAARKQQERLAMDLVEHDESLSDHCKSPGQETKDNPNQDDTVTAEVPQVSNVFSPSHKISVTAGSGTASTKPNSPQITPVSVRDESKLEGFETKNASPTPPHILMSGMGQQEREEYSILVQQLGGVILDSAQYDHKCSHLVVGNPARNEKFLSSIAAGKWVLCKSYFDACKEAGKFVKEECHEWGSVHTTSVLKNASAQVIKLAEAAHRWRKWLHEDDNHRKGAFDGWRVMLLTDKKKENGFRRLLEAGGGLVITDKYPCAELEEVTHAFIDINKIKFKIDLKELVSARVHCLKPEYIAAYLMDNPAPDPKQYYLQDVIPLMSDMSDDVRKRKVSETEQTCITSNKRSRR